MLHIGGVGVALPLDMWRHPRATQRRSLGRAKRTYITLSLNYSLSQALGKFLRENTVWAFQQHGKQNGRSFSVLGVE